MTFHLTDSEVVDAAEGRLAPTRRPHLSGCAVCQASVDEVRAILATVADPAAGDVPEPGAEFWAQFSANVRAEVADAPVPQTTTWWQGSSSGWALLAAAAAVLLAIWVPNRSVTETAVPLVEPEVVASVSIDDVRWQLMTDVLSELPDDQVVAVLAPSSLALDASVDGLSPQEREAFRRLLENGLNQESD